MTQAESQAESQANPQHDHQASLGLMADPTILQNRKLGASLLKLSDADLHHGLELHDQSVVIDIYGFSAIANPDVPRLLEARAQGISPTDFVHMRTQMLLTRMADVPQEAQYFSQAWSAAGVTCLGRNSGEESNVPDRLIRRLAHNTYTTDKLPGVLRRSTTAADILAAKREGRHCFMYTTNAVPLMGRLDSVDSEISLIETFRQFGVRMMHLTYNRRNLIGEGCAEINDGGLSDLGRHVVAKMNQAGVIVDLAHASPKTAIEAAKVSNKPIVVSHACCRALHHHYRNVPDEVMRAVADTGGVVGMTCIPGYLGQQGDITRLIDHLDYAIKLVGIDHVGIGTDVPYTPPGFNDLLKQLSEGAQPEQLVWDSLWAKNDALFDPKWAQPQMVGSLAWTNWPLFTAGLVQRGYSDSDIQKVIGGNFMRVLSAVDAG